MKCSLARYMNGSEVVRCLSRDFESRGLGFIADDSVKAFHFFPFDFFRCEVVKEPTRLSTIGCTRLIRLMSEFFSCISFYYELPAISARVWLELCDMISIQNLMKLSSSSGIRPIMWRLFDSKLDLRTYIPTLFFLSAAFFSSTKLISRLSMCLAFIVSISFAKFLAFSGIL